MQLLFGRIYCSYTDQMELNVLCYLIFIDIYWQTFVYMYTMKCHETKFSGVAEVYGNFIVAFGTPSAPDLDATPAPRDTCGTSLGRHLRLSQSG